MGNPIAIRISERLKAVKLSAQAASIQAGLSKDTLRKLLGSETQIPAGKTLTGLAKVLRVSEQWILTGEGPVDDVTAIREDGSLAFTQIKTPTPTWSEIHPANVPIPNRADMPNDVPVRGTAAGSHLKGAFQVTSDVIDYVRRPPALTGARDVYALFVEGSSMEPQYFPGDLIYVHPHRPPRIGDVIVVQAAIDEVNVEATLGVYAKRTERHLSILKRNPESHVQIKREHIKSIHKVLTTNELFGV
jgi:phage repressor protein C with HTH and peptisase S24 domain